jgi:hypothetical protein
MRFSELDLEGMLERVRAFCCHPRIMDPEFVLNPAAHPHAAGLKEEFGLFDPVENRVYINVPEVCEKLGLVNMEALLVYQFLHYALAPFDSRTALRLTASARMALEETRPRGSRTGFREALSIQRLFCDMINVTYAARNGMAEEMVSLYRALDRTKGWRA